MYLFKQNSKANIQKPNNNKSIYFKQNSKANIKFILREPKTKQQ